MKYIIKYKSRFDGKSRTEILGNLNELIQVLLKANELTDDRDSIIIQSHAQNSIVVDALNLALLK